MKPFNKFIISAAALLAAAPALAQNTYSGYFLDNYNYRYEMNPAFGNSKNMVSFPVLGNFNLAMRGILHLSDVIYNINGKSVLFTNPGISASEVMGKISNKNRLGVSPKIDILAVGFKALGGYNTVTLSARADVEASIPKAFFSIAKEGITNATYDIKDMTGYAEAYAQLALNHSRDIDAVPGLRVGAAVKVLIGAGNIDFRFNRAELELGTDAWRARTNGDIYASIKGFKFDTDTYEPKYEPADGQPLAPYDYVSGGNLDDFSAPNGFGLGFDLGAEYEWNDFRFSAAVLDLGFMNWGTTQWASTDGTREFTTDAYIFNANGDAVNSFDNEFKNLQDGISRLYQLKEMGEMSSRTKALGATLNFGIDYTFPLYRNLHFGLLSSTRINGPYTWTQARLSANIAPVKIFSADANIKVGTYGVGFGWLLNLNAPYFNLFLGMDHTVGKLSKQLIPVNSNAEFNIGINFPF